MIFIAWFAWEKNRSSASSCMHSSNLSTLTNPVTKLTHMASFYLWEPPKNNGLSNCSLLTLLSTHFVKSCSSAVLFYDADQYWSISTGKGWSQPEIIVSMPSPVVFRLSSLALMLFSLYTSKTLSTQLHDLKRKLNVLQKLMKNLLYVFRFGFFIDTFLAYAMKSIITFLWWSVGGKCVGIFFVIILLSSVVSSDLFGFRIKPLLVRCM